MAADRVRARKGFEYKMSKKVAELTQVVHMLFMRNHEREVEIQLTKELYNKELDRQHQKYQLQTEKLKVALKAYENKSKSGENDEIIKARIDEALRENEARWIKKYDALEVQLKSEKDSNVQLQELVKRLQSDFNNLQTSSNESSLAFSAQLSNKENEVEYLHQHMAGLEKKLREAHLSQESTSEDLQKTLSKLESESQQQRSMLDEAKMNEDKSQKRALQLEGELKLLKKELAKKSTEISTIRRSATIRTPPSQPPPAAPQSDLQEILQQQNRIKDELKAEIARTRASALFQQRASALSQQRAAHKKHGSVEVYEELENLRRLVQKYRLELSNREGNFNRMFTDKTPVHVDHRNRSSILPQTKLTSRDKSFSYAMSQPYGSATETDTNHLSSGESAVRVDSSVGSRRSNSTLTGIRRGFQQQPGRQLLSQYSQQPPPPRPQPPEKRQNLKI